MNLGVVASICIVSYRTPELAARCHETAVESVDVPACIKLVDTSDGPGVIDSSHLPGEAMCEYLGNVGYGAALNHGFADAFAPVLIGTNADVEFPSEGIAELISIFGAEPDVGVIGPRQVSPDGRIVHAGIEKAGDPSGGRGYGEADEGQYAERLTDVEQVSGSVMLIRRDVFQRAGGFPADVKLYYEDAIFCARVRALGYRVVYSGTRTFTHHVAASPQPPETRAALAAASRRRFEAI